MRNPRADKPMKLYYLRLKERNAGGTFDAIIVRASTPGWARSIAYKNTVRLFGTKFLRASSSTCRALKTTGGEEVILGPVREL